MALPDSSPIYTDIPICFPVLVVIGGNCSDAISKSIQSLSGVNFSYESSSVSDKISEFRKKSISIPPQIQGRFIVCPSVTSFIQISRRLDKELAIALLSQYSVISVVDYGSNSDVLYVKSCLSVFMNPNIQGSYILFNAPQNESSVTSYFPHKLRQDSKILTEFISIASIQFSNYFNSSQSLTQILISKLPFQLAETISTDGSRVFAAIDNYIKDKNAKTSPTTLGFVYEYAGMLEDSHRGSVARYSQLARQFPTEVSIWNLDTTYPDFPYIFFSIACGFYSKYGDYLKAADCALRVVAHDYPVRIDSASKIICQYISSPGMVSRAWDLLTLCKRMNRTRKAALLAYSFYRAFDSSSADRVTFQLEAIRLFREQKAGIVVLRDLYIPLISELETPGIDHYTIKKLVFDTLTIAGTYLNEAQQKALFKILSNLSKTVRISLKEFHFYAANGRLCDSFFSLKQKSKDSKASSLIYNAFGTTSVERYVLTGQQLSLKADVFNPFLVDLPVKINVMGSVPSIATLKKSGGTEVHFFLETTRDGSYQIDSIDCEIYGAVQNLKLPKSIRFVSLSTAPFFTLRSSLPFNSPIEVIEGEIMSFRFWIFNAGSSPIRNTQILCKECSAFSYSSKTPIVEPQTEAAYDCELRVEAGLKSLEFEILCTYDGSDYQTSVSVSQPISVGPSIQISNLVSINDAQIKGFNGNTDSIVGIELRNDTNDSFSFSAEFNGLSEVVNSNTFVSKEKRSWVIGKKSVSMFFIYLKKDDMKLKDEVKDKARLIEAKKAIEAKLGRKLSAAEMKNFVRKAVNFTAYLENHLKIYWNNAEGKRGEISISNLLPESQILESFEKVFPVMKCRLIEDGHEVTEVRCGNTFTLEVTFEIEKVMECSLDFGTALDPKNGVVWIGSLKRRANDGGSHFEFQLCFLDPGSYEINVNYSSISGKQGYRSQTVRSVI